MTTWKLQSSVHGKIMRLLMVEGNDINNTDFKAVLRQMISKKSKHTQLIVISNTKSRRENLAAELGKPDKEGNIVQTMTTADRYDPNVVVLLSPNDDVADLELDMWARDPLLVFQSLGVKRRVKIFNDERGKNYVLATSLVNAGLADLMDTPDWLNFAGGNILADGEYIFIGEEVLTNSDNNNSESRQKVANNLAIQLGFDISKVITLASTGVERHSLLPVSYDKVALRSLHPDFFHIDLFLTLTGEKRPRYNGKAIILLANLINLGTDNSDIMPLNLVLEEMNQNLCTDFFVLRNMVPCVPYKGTSTYLYYNNCIVENTSETKTVWLPSFKQSFKEPLLSQVDFFEKHNAQIWELLGFEVRFIESDFAPFSNVHGGLHCLTKELLRE